MNQSPTALIEQAGSSTNTAADEHVIARRDPSERTVIVNALLPSSGDRTLAPEEPDSLQSVEVSYSSKQSYKPLQSFLGIVESVRVDEFDARVHDLTNPRYAVELITFSAAEVDDDDLPLLNAGATFYWYIGYQGGRGGRRRLAEIRFRRLPPFTMAELRNSKQRAENIRKLFADGET